MAEINGTSGADVYTVKSGDLYNGMDGDDIITIERGGTAQGNAGNDTITALPGLKLFDTTVWYWYSPGTIYIDLQAGYALDGYGFRDTLINIHQIHGFSRNGDQGYGSNEDDAFYVGVNYNVNNKKGMIIIDGRGGDDWVTIGPSPNDLDKLGKFVATASPDGRLITAYF
ncbi:MAG: hypothetical protein EBT37_03165, partial [Betaproteobacteria bacterium]|nr:hypothetical protein [Betaproteobacteria bacterium]